MIDNSKEYILCAAVQVELDVSRKDVFDPVIICGYRHNDCLHIAAMVKRLVGVLSLMDEKFIVYTQGFMTSKHRFVDRREAGLVAMLAGQLKEGSREVNLLFSEDLY